MSVRKKPAHISQKDWDELDIPELTDEDFARMRPAREVFPDFDFPKPRRRGPQKAPTKLQATVRFDRDVIEYFRGTGPGWQTRMNETLRRGMEREKRRAKS
jgi:uncharacterized protein (DUF4415 family)